MDWFYFRLDQAKTVLFVTMAMSVRTGIKQVKVERPRPLKIGGGTQPQVGVDDLVVVVDSVRRTLSGGESPGASFDVVSQLQTLSANLKLSGAQLESSHKVIS